MTDCKPLEEMTSDELYALAQERQMKEQEKEREAARAKIDELKAVRREMLARHKKELSAVEAEIEELGGKTRTRTARSTPGLSDKVLEIVEEAGEISTKDIRAKLDSLNVTAGNLSQTLAYLKKQGRVVSPARSIYARA